MGSPGIDARTASEESLHEVTAFLHRSADYRKRHVWLRSVQLVATSRPDARRWAEGSGELAWLRAEKPLWGKRSSSPSLHHRSGGAMRVCAVLGEGLGELARLRAEKPQRGKTLLLAIIASSLGRGLYTHAHSVYVIASRTCTCTCVCTWVRATTSQAQQGLMLWSAAQSHSAQHGPIAQRMQSGGAHGHKATWRP